MSYVPYDMYVDRIKRANTIKQFGKITQVVGLVIESAGPAISIGRLCNNVFWCNNWIVTHPSDRGPCGKLSHLYELYVSWPSIHVHIGIDLTVEPICKSGSKAISAARRCTTLLNVVITAAALPISFPE